MKRRFLVIGLIIMYALSINLDYPKTEAAHPKFAARTNPQNIQADSLTPPNIPVTIGNIVVAEADGRDLSNVNYSITNQTSNVVKRIHLTVFVFNEEGRFVGGEGWRENVNLEAFSTKGLNAVLRNKVMLGGRIVLIVEQAEQKQGTWLINPSELISIVKTFINNGFNGLPSAVFRNGQMQTHFVESIGGTDYCTVRLAEARESCGSGGISSFSCNPSSGAFSFTCR
jgi:hypothetical protein